MEPINEQSNGFVVADGSRKELPILEAWKRSSSVYWVWIPPHCQSVIFKVGNRNRTGFSISIRMEFHPKRNLWRAYIPGRYLTEKAETVYKIVGSDENGSREVLGEGVFRIHEGTAEDYEDEVYTADECYVLFDDQLWRRVTVSEVTGGAKVLTVERDGIHPSVFEKVPHQPYALNLANSLYYAIGGTVGSSGVPVLTVSQTGASNKSASSARDDSTGFRYRIEAETTQSQTVVLKVGNRIQE